MKHTWNAAICSLFTFHVNYSVVQIESTASTSNLSRIKCLCIRFKAVLCSNFEDRGSCQFHAVFRIGVDAFDLCTAVFSVSSNLFSSSKQLSQTNVHSTNMGMRMCVYVFELDSGPIWISRLNKSARNVDARWKNIATIS